MSPPKKIPRLPVELVDAIIGFVDGRKDVWSACLANSFMHKIGLRHLYRSLDLHYGLRTMRICRTILCQPTVALYVVWLSISCHNEWEVGSPPDPGKQRFAPAYFRLVFRAIQAMKNLKKVRFTEYSPFEGLPAENMGLSVVPQLYRLIFRGTNINVLLSLLPSLKELVVVEVFDNSLENLPSNALPALRRLCCAKTHLAFIIPHRAIELVDVFDYMDPHEVLVCVQTLSKARCPTKRLELSVRRLSWDTFEHVCVWLPNLEELAIHDIWNHVDNVLGHDRTLAAMRKFLRLRRLCFFSLWRFKEDEGRTIIQALGNRCPTLSELTCIERAQGWTDFHRISLWYSYTRNISAESEWLYEHRTTPLTLHFW